jgi:hypothetical protein
VTASGATEDDRASLEEARAAAPHLALKARAADPGALDGLRGLVVETAAAVPSGLYRLGPDEALVAPVTARPLVEDVMDVARTVLRAARAGVPSALWVAAGPGLEALPEALVEEKLAILAEGARQARLYLAKEQFEI